MALLPDGRQYPLLAVVDFLQTELPTGVAVPVLQLPQNSVVTQIDVVIDTAFDSVTSDTIDVGDATLATRYSTSINGQTAGSVQAGVPTGFQTTDAEPNIELLNTAVGTEGTAGVGRLIVEYYIDGRHNENQG